MKQVSSKKIFSW